MTCFNRRRDACFLATEQSTFLLPVRARVSIADATLASSQHSLPVPVHFEMESFNRRRDACFLATIQFYRERLPSGMFQSQTRRLLPRNFITFPSQVPTR